MTMFETPLQVYATDFHNDNGNSTAIAWTWAAGR